MIHPLIVNENYVKYDEYSSKQLIAGMLDCKCVPSNTQTSAHYYYELPLMYQYDYEDDFIIEGCPMDSLFGIKTNLNKHGLEYSLLCKISNPQFFDIIYKDIAQIIFTHKGQLRLFMFKADRPADTGFKHPVFRPIDYNTKEILPNRDPTIILKLQNGFLNQTIFTDKQGKIISWHELRGTHIKLIPYIRITHVHISNRPYLQFTMIKATVLYFGPLIKQSVPVIIPNEYSLEVPDVSGTYITYQNYDSSLLSHSPVNAKWNYEIPISYYIYEIPLSYNYNGLHKDFLIEGPEVTSEHGIMTENTNYYMELSDNQFIRQIYQDCLQILDNYKRSVKMYYFNPDEPEYTGFPFDMTIKICNYYQHTIFVDPHGQILPWDLLKNKVVTLIPLLLIKHIHIRHVATLQIILESAIVTSVK